MAMVIRVNFTLPEPVVKQLEFTSKKLKVPKSRLVSQALTKLFSGMKSRELEGLVKESFEIYGKEDLKITEEFRWADAETLKNIPNDW